MKSTHKFSRRAFVAATVISPLALSAKSQVPIGLELYSVREGLKADPMGTLESVAKMGYQCVEFFSPYFDWTPAYAHTVRAKLDALKIKCHSTHNDLKTFSPEPIKKAIELNTILGSSYVVCAHPGDVTSLKEWTAVAETLNKGNEQMAHAGLHAGYHNHDLEWKPVEGKVPMELLAASTDKSIMLQLDVGTCLEAGRDPVEWIEANPGRIRSLHLKDWSPDKGYKVLFGEGKAPWKQIFAAAESKGGVEYYLIEQEGSRFSETETAAKCLAAYKELRRA